MIICKIRPKNPDSYAQLIQSLNSKKVRYFIDIIKGQIISFADNAGIDASFFHSVTNFCNIDAVMTDTNTPYPFIENDLNHSFSTIVQYLQAMEKADVTSAKKCLAEFEAFVTNYAISSNSNINTLCSTSFDESTDSCCSNYSDDITDEGCNSADTPMAENKDETDSTSNAYNDIPNEILSCMTTNELALYPYVKDALNKANNSNSNDKLTQIKSFLESIEFSDESYIIRMFCALNNISSVTYKSIFSSEDFQKNRVYSDKEIRSMIRVEFRTWATKACPNEIEKNHLLSFIDLLKLYKKFVK